LKISRDLWLRSDSWALAMPVKDGWIGTMGPSCAGARIQDEDDGGNNQVTWQSGYFQTSKLHLMLLLKNSFPELFHCRLLVRVEDAIFRFPISVISFIMHFKLSLRFFGMLGLK